MKHESSLIRVGIGQVVVETGPVLLKATLGSCVGLAFIWRARNCYGLAHCLLPDSPLRAPGIGARHVDQAIDSLLQLMQASRADHAQIEAHVAGGGNMMQRTPVAGRAPHIGQLNGEAALRHLAQRGITVHSVDLGGDQARQILLDCASAQVTVLRLPAPR